MPKARLLNPAGDCVGILEGAPSHEAIVRLAYGLDEADMVTGVLDGDTWSLTILAFAERPAGEITRPLNFTLKVGAVPVDQVEGRLMELAVLDLWDRGWSLEPAAD